MTSDIAQTDGVIVETSPSRHRDLGIRTVSALALIAVGFMVVLAGGVIYAAWLGFLGALLALEWATLIGRGRLRSATIVHAGAALGAPFVVLAGGVVEALGLLAGAMIVSAVAAPARRAWSALGAVYVLAPQIALMTLRDPSATPLNGEPIADGLRLTIGFFVIVGLTDTASLFVGRGVGGPHLPGWISGGKTWSGLIGGAVCGTLGGVAFAQIWLPASPIFGVCAVSASIAIATQAGDVAESILKRHFGIKDVGRLIPGHGGAMDRFDGALLAAPAAGLWASLL